MIYLCQIFSLPGKLCSCACTNCREICQSCCEDIRRVCKSAREAIAPVTRGPLAMYVVATWTMMLLVVASFGHKLSQTPCPPTRNFSCAVIGMALVHAMFAFYLQRRISGPMEEYEQMSHKELTDKTIQVLLYDFGVC